MASMQCLRSMIKVNSLTRAAIQTLPATHLCSKRQETTHAKKFSGTRRRAEYIKELYERRIAVGPEKERHPSEFLCWSHDAEIYAFGERFGEKFDQKILNKAFTQESYVIQEKKKQAELGLDVDFETVDNRELAQKGIMLASRFIKAYLRFSYPQMFEEGICAIHDYLMSDSTLFLVASNIGLRELIKSADYPPVKEDYIRTFMAVIGALAESQDINRAELFVADFIIPQLVNKDINELWTIHNPMGVLVGMLKEAGRGEPEPRLLWTSAKNTIMSVYHVGIYSEQKLIGKSPGESIDIAEEMAARDAIKNILNTSDSRAPLVLGDKLRDITLDYERTNRSVWDVLS